MAPRTTKTKRIPMNEGELVKNGPNIKPARKIKHKNFNVLMESGIISEFVGDSGQYAILPKGARLLNAVCTLLDKRIRKPLHFEEVLLPKIAPVDTFRKAGVLGKWDRYLLSAKPFSDTSGVTAEYLLDPLQCTAFYQIHENMRIDTSIGPIKWFDRSGPTYRNEDRDKIAMLVKQREFHRAEFMYIGTVAQVIRIREECLARLERLCIELGLLYRIVVGSSCYQTGKEEAVIPQIPEEIPIKDLEIYCPGHRGSESFLEIVGSAVLATLMTSRFNITNEDGTELWSGCTGIGLERMMYALITNYGTNFEDFPSGVRRLIG